MENQIFLMDGFADSILDKIESANKKIKNLYPRKGYWIHPSTCEKAYYKQQKDLGYEDINLPYFQEFGNYIYLIYCVSKRIAKIEIQENRNGENTFSIKTDFSKQEYLFNTEKCFENLIYTNLSDLLVEEAELRLLNNY